MSLAVQTFDPARFEVIAINDGSSDATEELLRHIPSQLPYSFRAIHQAKSGPSRARNVGIDAAEGRLCLIMNDDAIADPEMLERHHTLHLQFGMNKKLVLVGNRITHPEQQRNIMNYIFDNLPLGIPLHRQKPGYCPPSHFITFNLSAHKSAFDDFGRFDETFTSALAEDTELGIRWVKQGCRIWFSDQPLAYHQHPLTVDSWKSRIVRQTGNARLMYAKHPEQEPGNAIWKQTNQALLEQIDRHRNTAEYFENILRVVEKKSIEDILGIRLNGHAIHTEKDFLDWVKQFAPVFTFFVAANALVKERGS
jgi:glycosyltransferase involved in cell wall biosynthesis